MTDTSVSPSPSSLGAEMIWLPICKLAQLPTNRAVGVTINGQRLVVARCGEDGAQILQGHCTHMGVPLDNAKVKDCAVICWLHQSTFSVADGSVIKWTTVVPLSGPALEQVKVKNMLHTFETRVEDGEVQLHWPGTSADSVDIHVRL